AATLIGMFTGIVQTRGRVARLDRNAFGLRLTVNTQGWTPAGGHRPGHGDSVCVAGVCLPVVEATPDALAFDVIAETLDKTAVRLRLTGTTRGWSPSGGCRPGHGVSISVSGVGLTVVEATPDALAFDVIAETLDKTTLGRLAPGDAVNLEPAVLPTQPMGGHF